MNAILLMKRYAGESLGNSPRVVVLGSCKVGNFVVSTPLLRGLKERWPESTVDFIGSDITIDFETSCPWIDWRCSWDSSSANSGLALLQTLDERRACHGPVDLAINLDGFNPVTQVLASWLQAKVHSRWGLEHESAAIDALGRSASTTILSRARLGQPRFSQPTSRVAQQQLHLRIVLSNGLIETDVHAISLSSTAPSFDVPDILIHCTTARAAKVWSFHNWRTVIDACTSKGLSVGIVGSPSKTQQDAYNSGGGEDYLLHHTALIDLRGRTSLIELAGACEQAKAVVSVDAGPMHIAAAVGTPTLALVGNDPEGTGASPIRLWLPRTSNLTRTISSFSCDKCASNRFRNDECLVDDHPCMRDVHPTQVINWLSTLPSLRSKWHGN